MTYTQKTQINAYYIKEQKKLKKKKNYVRMRFGPTKERDICKRHNLNILLFI